MSPKTSDVQAKMEKELADLVAEKEERFEAFMENTREAVWRIDFKPPISLNSPESQQIREFFENSVIGEANDAMARMYGYAKGRELIDRAFGKIMPISEAKNVDAIAKLVRDRFRSTDGITYEKRIDGSVGVYLNTAVPAVENGKVQHIWGSSLDITELSEIQERLKWSMEELGKQKEALKEKNIYRPTFPISRDDKNRPQLLQSL
jgi:PAS domain S-box-containing protein